MAEITGTVGNDLLEGTAEDDRIVGLDGDDTIRGGDGNDELFGGNGDNLIYGDRGNDLVFGADGTGEDRLYGGAGNDRIFAYARGGSDLVDGGGGKDLLVLGFLDGATNNTYRAFGGSGSDSVYVENGGGVLRDLSQPHIVRDPQYTFFNRIDLGTGNDVINIVGGTNIVTTGAGADRIFINSIYGLYTELRDYTPGIDSLVQVSIPTLNWDGATNPFADGTFRLVQDGADAYLQYATGYNNEYYLDLVRYIGVNVADLTAADVGGWNPNGGRSRGVNLTGTEGDDGVFYDAAQVPLSGLLGTVGDDTVDAKGGNDRVETMQGDDTVYGGAGNDAIYSGPGDDFVDLGDGDDFVEDEGGADTLLGGSGADRFVLSLMYQGHTVVRAGSGDDTIFANNYSNPFVTARGTAELYGNAGNDTFGFGGDRINDPLRHIATDLVINAGSGEDKIFVNGVSRYAVATLGSESDTIDVAGFVGDTVAMTVTDFDVAEDAISLIDYTWIKNLTNTVLDANLFETGHFRLARSGEDTVLQIDADGGGDNFTSIIILEGVRAADLTARNFTFVTSGAVAGEMAPHGVIKTVTLGTHGSDRLSGTARNNTIEGLAGNDRISGGEGDDLIRGGEGNDVLSGNGGRDTLDGGMGVDTASYAAATAGVVVSLDKQGVFQGTREGSDKLVAIENLAGSNYDDRLSGDSGDNTIDGRRGNDVLSGGEGNDTLKGGTGNDTLDGGSGQDRLVGGSGNDTYVVHDVYDAIVEGANGGKDTVISSVTWSLSDGLENLVLGDGDLNGYGNALDNVIEGGTRGDNQLSGYGGNDTLYGYGGKDMLSGDDGDDRLIGGTGADELYGGNGADMFVFDDGDLGNRTGNTDRIVDFWHFGGDRINLRAIDADTGRSGDQNFSFIGDAGFSGQAGELRYEFSGNQTVVQMDVDGDGNADLILLLDLLHTLQQNDFVL